MVAELRKLAEGACREGFPSVGAYCRKRQKSYMLFCMHWPRSWARKQARRDDEHDEDDEASDDYDDDVVDDGGFECRAFRVDCRLW
jgi:hypothetical protein